MTHALTIQHYLKFSIVRYWFCSIVSHKKNCTGERIVQFFVYNFIYFLIFFLFSFKFKLQKLMFFTLLIVFLFLFIINIFISFCSIKWHLLPTHYIPAPNLSSFITVCFCNLIYIFFLFYIDLKLLRCNMFASLLDCVWNYVCAFNFFLRMIQWNCVACEITRNHGKKAELNVVFYDFDIYSSRFFAISIFSISQIRHWERNNYCTEDSFFFSKKKPLQKKRNYYVFLFVFSICTFTPQSKMFHSSFFCLLSLSLFLFLFLLWKLMNCPSFFITTFFRFSFN